MKNSYNYNLKKGQQIGNRNSNTLDTDQQTSLLSMKTYEKKRVSAASPMRISLSKIKLNGSTDTLKTMEEVRQSVKQSSNTKIMKIGANYMPMKDQKMSIRSTKKPIISKMTAVHS